MISRSVNIIYDDQPVEPMRVGYARESTTKHEQDQPLEWHIKRLEDYGCDRIFVDRMSGSSKKRPAYNEMMDLVRRGEVAEVVVSNVKRFGRSLVGIVQGVEEIRTSGAKFTCLDEDYNFSTAAGRALFNLNAAMAQLEKETIQERINAGYDGVRQAKKPMRAPFGYKMEQLEGTQRRLVVDPELVEICRWLRQRVIDVGQTPTCKEFNKKYPDLPKAPRTPGGIKNWLRCETLYGHLQYNRHKANPIVHRNNHEALFTEAERLETERAFEFRKTHFGFRQDPTRYPWTGLLYCARCQASLSVAKGRNKVYYRCYNRFRGKCDNAKYISVLTVEEAVFGAFVERADAIAQKAADQGSQPAASPKLDELRSQLRQLEAMGNSPHLDGAKQGIKDEIAMLEASAKRDEAVNSDRYELLKAFCELDFWQTIPDEGKAKSYRTLVKRVLCLGKEVVEVELWI